MPQNLYKFDVMKKEQHDAVRKAAGWYYFTHQLIEVAGEDATNFLEWMYPKPIATLLPGTARYTTLLKDDGTILDDEVIFRLEENKYWISTLYTLKVLPWFEAHKGEYKVDFRHITSMWDMFSVQGPVSRELLNHILKDSIDDQKFFTIRDNWIGDMPVKVARAGFSGEKFGYEIYVSSENKEMLRGILRETGPKYNVKEITEVQIMVWTLPTERGLYLMSDLRKTNPFEAELEKGFDWEKDFVGKKAALKIRDAGPARKLVGFTVENDEAWIPSRNLGDSGAPVMLGEECIGWVTKYTYGYTCGKDIGLAIVENGKVEIGSRVMLNGYEAVITDKVFA